MYVLTVIHPFANYKRGDLVTDPEAVQKILDSENAPKVVRVNPPPTKS